jgi:hypothetical protein
MKILVYVAIATTVGVLGFSPTPQKGARIKTARSMSIVDDWKTFFSPEEFQHRQEEHKKEMTEMRLTQKQVLERRRDPQKMSIYHKKEVQRHNKLDHLHDVDIEHEISQEWIPNKKPLTKQPYEKKVGHSVFDNWQAFFSKPEFDHRRVQHHLEQLDTADAEQEILQRRRDPSKMKAYKQKEEARHQLLDKQHEVEVGFEFAEEKVLGEGQDFIGGVSNISLARYLIMTFSHNFSILILGAMF